MTREQASRLRRGVAAAIFALLIVGGIEPFYFRVLARSRESLSQQLMELPYRKAPGLRLFLLHVRETTPKGSTIAIVTPRMQWNRGYEYAFSRATYQLAGRDVLALVGPRDDWRPDELQKARYVAAWHSECPFAGYALVWRDANGTLSRRTE